MSGWVPRSQNCLESCVLNLDLFVVQDKMDADWKDLPADLVQQVAGSCDGALKAMRAVCQSWKADLDPNTTEIHIIKSDIPSYLPSRFPSLRALHLQGFGSMLSPQVIRRLQVLS